MTSQVTTYDTNFTAAYCGRFNPPHVGHEAVINEMLRLFGPARSRVIVGSANASQSLRHFFSYEERRLLLKTIFPDTIWKKFIKSIDTAKIHGTISCSKTRVRLELIGLQTLCHIKIMELALYWIKS